MNDIKTLLALILLLSTSDSLAQETTRPRTIQIDTAGVMRGERVGEAYIQYLSLNVELSHQGTKMYCDSCVLDEAKKSFKAYGDVSIIQPDGSTLSADYIYYNGRTKSTTARGNVVLTDPPSTLWTDHLDYNLDSKIGHYQNGGVLMTDNTTLWSDKGRYDGKSHWTHFTRDVIVQGEDYYVTSRELKYNTESKDVIFLDKSTIYKDQSIMITEGGTYNSETEFADFYTPTTVINDDQTIHADKLKYDKEQGVALAMGDVRIEDTAEHVILFSDEAYYFDDQRKSITYGDPLLIRYKPEGIDSFFLLSDTLMTYDLPSEVRYFVEKDSLGHESTVSDTVYAKNFLAWHDVRAYTDSFQAVGDSMFYSELDSALRFYQDPIMWSDMRQMKGDTIYAFLSGSSDLDSLLLLTNSSILSTPKGIDDGLDQILGTWISSYFIDGEMSHVDVQKNAQNMLYVTDDDDMYIGIFKSESNSVLADFTEGRLDSIKFYENIDGEMLPMKGADYGALKFEKSILYTDRRPMDKAVFYSRTREQKKAKKSK